MLPGAVIPAITTDPKTGKQIAKKITPGHEYFKTKGDGDMFTKFEIRLLTEDGETLNYSVPGELGAKHWVITISGTEGDKWRVTGVYKHTKVQKSLSPGIPSDLIRDQLLTSKKVLPVKAQ